MVADGGISLIDIANPFVWACWDGEEEHKPPRPGDGYDYDLRERTHFDPIGSRFADTWWVTDIRRRSGTQNIVLHTRGTCDSCLEGTGLDARFRACDWARSSDSINHSFAACFSAPRSS